MMHACRDNRPAVDENGNALEWKEDALSSCDPTETVTEGCRSLPHKYEMVHQTADHIALFHYAVKSREDFEIKLNRGNGFTRNWRFFDSTDK
jgi:hypothetical protein